MRQRDGELAKGWVQIVPTLYEMEGKIYENGIG